MKVLGVEVQPAEAEREPLVDVPAIVMPDAAQNASAAEDAMGAPPAKPKARNSRASKATSAQGRSKTRGRPAAKAAQASPAVRRAAKATAQAAATKRTRDGSVGRDTFAAVQALVKGGKTKSQAFQQVAEKTGRNLGTVSANYYRVARSQGATNPRRKRGQAATSTRTPRAAARGTRRRNGTTDIDHLTADLVRSVTALADAVKAQGKDVAELRSRLEGVRKVIS